jgi:hypothetical protein
MLKQALRIEGAGNAASDGEVRTPARERLRARQRNW